MKLLAGVLLLGALGGAVAVMGGGGEGSREISPDLYTVSRTSFDITTLANGELEARRQTELRSRLETVAAIVEIVPEGLFVEAGTELVKLSDEELRRKLQDEELSLEAGKSNLVSAQNDLAIQISDNDSALKQAELAVQLAELELQKWLEGDYKKELTQHNLDVESAELEEERLRKNLERSEQLQAEGFLSENQLEQDRLSYIRAKNNLEIARIALQVFEEYEVKKRMDQLRSDLEEARAELERTKQRNASRLESKRAAVRNAERQVEIRQERVDRLREQIDACVVKAPTAGLVVYKTSLDNDRGWGGDDGPLKIGTEIRPNESIIVLPDTSSMLATIKVHESLVGRIEEGLPARVRIDAARGRTFSGKVEEIGIIAESGGWRDPNLREYEVKIALELPEGSGLDLKPGMRCEAEVILDRVEDAVAVPVQAVFFDGGESFVYVPREGKYARVAVEVGRRSDLLAEIRGGLEVGDQVLLREPSPGRILREPSESAEATVAAM